MPGFRPLLPGPLLNTPPLDFRLIQRSVGGVQLDQPLQVSQGPVALCEVRQRCPGPEDISLNIATITPVPIAIREQSMINPKF